MWHDDNWQPYAEYDAPATSSWRHYRSGASSSMQQGEPLNGGLYARHNAYGRHYQPYARPHHSLPPQHSPTLAGAAREMTWRNVNDGWSPSMHGASMTPGWHDEMAAYHHRQRQLAHAHARAAHAAALSKLSSVEITTPHAGGELRAKPIICEDDDAAGGTPAATSFEDENSLRDDRAKKPLYSDFSAPEKPRDVELRIEATAIRITIFWTFPELSSLYKYKQKIEVRDNLTIIEEDTLAAHITSFRFKSTPGAEYHIRLTIFDLKGAVVANGSKTCRAVFSLDEIDRLYTKALDFTGTAMQPFSFLYRCKPKIYWDDIYLRRNGIMERYLKDNNGQAASPINGEISGMFFSAKTLSDGSLPPSSPFGDIRMILPAISILDPTRISAFFCDFYCNRLMHYITVVICEKESQTERFCRLKLRPLDLKDNRFLRIVPSNGPNMYSFFCNRSVWVEVYYTENIPMHWGRFDHIYTIGAGTSRIGGLPHNKSCLTCNLYPIGPQSGVNMEPVEDLVASYENNQAQQRQNSTNNNGYLFARNSTRYTALGCIQAELLSPSSSISAEVSKKDYLEVADVIVYCVDSIVYRESQERLAQTVKIVFGNVQEPAKKTIMEENENGEIVVKQEVVPDKPRCVSSSEIMKRLDEANECLPKSAPLVTNLISKIRALVAEISYDFNKLNDEIDFKRV